MTAFSQITQTLNLYFDTLYYCDLDKFDKVFHKHAIYATTDETPLFHNMVEYRQVIQKRISPASKNEPRLDFIDSIEIAGQNTARARVRCSIGSRDFVDFLTLVYEEKQWKIISKVFQVIHK